MFRRLVITVAAMLAIAVVPVLLAEPAQAGRGGGGGGGGGAYSHSGGGGGGGGVHPSGAVHSGSLHTSRSGIHSPSTRGTRHSTASYHGPKHSVTRSGKTSSHKSLTNKSLTNKSLTNKSLTNKSLTNKSLTNKSLNRHTNWNHNNKFFGRRVFAVWFGPIFWPYAFYDLFDYVFWACDGYYYYSYGCYDNYGPFWAYGYDDLFGGIYWPYAYGGYGGDYRGYGSSDRYRRGHQVARNDPRSTEPQGARPDELTQLCGGEAASLVHFPFDRIEQRVQPTEAQRASFEELKTAAAKAAEKLKAACPSEPASGPFGRLDTAEQRLDAMLDAVSAVRGPLMKFYGSLGDQQKARLDAMGLSPDREAAAGGGRQTQAGVVPRICSERSNAVAQLSIEDIEKNVRPTDAQRQNLEDLRNASARAADAIRASCPSKTQLTVTARIEAVEGRLGAMLDALKTVRGPLEKFYDSLSDEQRARFNRMGPANRRTG
jgi:hypothetical protein